MPVAKPWGQELRAYDDRLGDAWSRPRDEQVAKRAFEIVRRRPSITLQQLIDELGGMDEPDVVVELLGDALEILIAARSRHAGTRREDARCDPPVTEQVWGPQPTDAQLTEARNLGMRTRRIALDGALDGALTRAEAARYLGITAQAVSDRLKAQQLVGLRRGREWRFPAWQFADDGVLPALGEVISAWHSTPLSLSTWAASPSPDLDGRTPQQELRRRGGPDRVIELERALAAAGW